MIFDKITEFNKSRWEAMAKGEIIFSRPWKNLDRESARKKLDSLDLLGDIKGKKVLCLASGGGQQSVAFALLGADVTVNHVSGDVKAAVIEATGGRGADVVVEHVGEATWRMSQDVASQRGRIVVCGATTGPNPPAALHRIWWKELVILGSSMGTKEDFEAAYDLSYEGYQHMFDLAATLASAIQAQLAAQAPVGAAQTGGGGAARPAD